MRHRYKVTIFFTCKSEKKAMRFFHWLCDRANTHRPVMGFMEEVEVIVPSMNGGSSHGKGQGDLSG
jgi:hypothetical protein